MMTQLRNKFQWRGPVETWSRSGIELSRTATTHRLGSSVDFDKA